jgi:tight adherence protein B
MAMGQLLLLAGVFIATVGVLIGGYLFINRRSLAQADAALERLRERDRSTPDSVRSILRDSNVSELPALDKLLAGKDVTALVAEQLQKGGLEQTTPASFILRVVVSSAAGFFLGTLFRGPIVGLLGLFVGFLIPIWWLRGKQKKRISMFRDQLPDAIDMLVSAMKAGYSFQAAMRFIGEEITTPLGPEFMRFYEEQRLGMEVRTALLALQSRIDSLDLKMFVTAVLIQRETGGNLSEVLGNIGTLMRERAALKADIETLTAESKMSARILSALPLVVFVLINLINSNFMKPMLSSTTGVIVFVSAAFMVMAGYFTMLKIADIDI